MNSIDFDHLEKICSERRNAFESAQPFAHVVIDDFLPRSVAEAVLSEFADTDAGWAHYHHYNEKKRGLRDVSRMGARTQALFADFQSQRFVRLMEILTGIDGLTSDPELDGAGLHQIMPGGFLNIHTDFLAHTTRPTWSRQLNLLLYFNKDWRPEYNGALEFWNGERTTKVQSIEPLFNRCVVFRTAKPSFHGHPQHLVCPPGMSRKSIALYYFRDEQKVQNLQPTNYQPVANDPLLKRLLIAADRGALWAYSMMKRRGLLTDNIIHKLLKRF